MAKRSYPKHPSQSAKWAERRVPHKLPVPKKCPYCSSTVEVRSHEQQYGKSMGQWPWLYACTNDRCGARVGMHPFTKLPLGTLADEETRKARTMAKNRFLFRFLNRLGIDRREGYRLLACEMGIPIASCHFGYFDIEKCRDAWRAIGKLGGA